MGKWGLQLNVGSEKRKEARGKWTLDLIFARGVGWEGLAAVGIPGTQGHQPIPASITPCHTVRVGSHAVPQHPSFQPSHIASLDAAFAKGVGGGGYGGDEWVGGGGTGRVCARL